MRSGVLHAGWHPIVRRRRNWKRCRPTVGKPQQLKLLGDQLVAVDENQTAGVERHRPSPRGANDMVLSDVHCMPRQIAEILDHRAADFAVGPRIDTHPHIHRHPAVAGIASRRASAFRPSSHPSSPRVVRVKIVTQLEHDHLTPHGIMVHDHPADPDRQNHRRGLRRVELRAGPPRPRDELPPVRIDLADGESVRSDASDTDAILSRFFGRDVELARAASSTSTTSSCSPSIDLTGNRHSARTVPTGSLEFISPPSRVAFFGNRTRPSLSQDGVIVR